jgi:hypothetical protein
VHGPAVWAPRVDRECHEPDSADARASAATSANTSGDGTPVAEQRQNRLPVLVRSALYALRGGFLVRPFIITILLGVAGATLSATEETVPTMGAWIPEILFPSRQDPQVAQAILSAIATSIMTDVSIVFAILLMTLTLAST